MSTDARQAIANVTKPHIAIPEIEKKPIMWIWQQQGKASSLPINAPRMRRMRGRLIDLVYPWVENPRAEERLIDRFCASL